MPVFQLYREALKHYKEHVKEAVKAKADVIICGAGLPVELPGIVRAAIEEFHYKKEEAPALAPIVSSEKAARIILKMWEKKYDCLPDLIIVEGPKAGGRLGFSREQLETVTPEQYDDEIVQSPVGMPGCALHNVFMKQVEEKKEPITRCYQCLEYCNPAKVPYCITKALVNAVKGDLDHGLIFCGANVGRIKQMMSVHDLIQELVP